MNPSSGVVSLALAEMTITLPTLLAELTSAQRGEVLVVSLSSRVPRLVRNASLKVLWLMIRIGLGADPQRHVTVTDNVIKVELIHVRSDWRTQTSRNPCCLHCCPPRVDRCSPLPSLKLVTPNP